jgi:Flp pilus assembly secretin CpaC
VDIDSAGNISGPVTTVTINPTTGKVSPTAPLTIARKQPGAVSLPDGRVLIIGGRNHGNSLATVEAYVPVIAAGEPSP